MPETETITLRGGPVPDKTIAWRGGDEVRMAYIKDALQPLEREAQGRQVYDYLVYRRSNDEPSRFDFIRIE